MRLKCTFILLYINITLKIFQPTNEIQTKTCSILFKVFKLNVSLVMTFYNLKKKKESYITIEFKIRNEL